MNEMDVFRKSHFSVDQMFIHILVGPKSTCVQPVSVSKMVCNALESGRIVNFTVLT